MVEISLSDCLSDWLQSFYFITSFLVSSSTDSSIDCFVGLVLPYLTKSLI